MVRASHHPFMLVSLSAELRVVVEGCVLAIGGVAGGLGTDWLGLSKVAGV